LITTSCFTVLGVASITPFLAALADPDLVASHVAIATLRDFLEIESDRQFFIFLGLTFFGLISLANFLSFLSLLAINRLSLDIGAWLHVSLFDEYIHRELSFHKRVHSSALETEIIQEVNRVVENVVKSGLTAISGAFSVALITVAIFILVDSAIATGAVVLLGGSYALAYRFARLRLVRDGQETSRYWRNRSKTISESFDAVTELTLLGAAVIATEEVANDSRKIARASASTLAIAASPRYLLECVAAIGLILASLWIYGRAGFGEWMTQLGFLSLAAYRLMPALQQVFTGLARARAHTEVFERMISTLSDADRAQRAHKPITPVDKEAWMGRPHEQIELSNVSFRYSPDRAGGVEEVSMRIPAGSIVGLVGPSGAGKTTLAELALGLLMPDEGFVAIDGIRLDENNRRGWYSTIAYVPQNLVLLDSTVAENICLGTAPDAIDVPRLEAAATLAQLDDLLRVLPGGLNGRIGEDGVRLSGGERQRVGIARALYRRASFLVLDEATSALDTANESKILELVSDLRDRCTIVIISHDANAIKGCDLLVRLDEGRLQGLQRFRADTRPPQATLAGGPAGP
jgi:HlyD family secretion protein